MTPESLDHQEITAATNARFRRFLTDLAWPDCSSVLCDLTDLPHASAEVTKAEQAESLTRMSRLAENGEVTGSIMATALILLEVLDALEDSRERAVWLTTYALAVVNMLEEMGYVEVAA